MAVAALANVAKIASAITIITGSRDAGLNFLLGELRARGGCKYFAQFAGSLLEPAEPPITTGPVGLVAAGK